MKNKSMPQHMSTARIVTGAELPAIPGPLGNWMKEPVKAPKKTRDITKKARGRRRPPEAARSRLERNTLPLAMTKREAMLRRHVRQRVSVSVQSNQHVHEAHGFVRGLV